MPRPPVISARNISKAYGPQTLFGNVSLTIAGGERVGLLGPNGTGKSTLLRVLAQSEPPDEGTLDRQRDARILFLAQEPTLDGQATPRRIVQGGLADWHEAMRRYVELTDAIEGGRADVTLLEDQTHVAESIERLGGWRRDHSALEMLEHLGVREIDRPVGTMSGGERRRVAIAQLLVSEPALAILDEPTNHLDTETIEWLEGYLAEKFSGAVLMVTHDRYVLDAIADRVLELEDGKLTEFQGGYADYLEQKAELVAHAERVEQNRLNLLRRERAWLMRGAKARSTKQKARLGRARTLLDAQAPKQASMASFADLATGAVRTGKTILDLEEVALEIEGKNLVASLTLHLVTGDRVGIVGPNGAGKTSLLKLVSGELSPARGRVVRGTNTHIVHFDQSRAALRDDWSVFDNVAEREGAERTGGGVVHIGDRSLEMRAYLEQFLFSGSKQRQKVGALSGGERARVALAKALRSGANLLLLDEPTNDLDVATLGALEELLLGWPGCALLVSHDRYFLDRVATSILAFEGAGKVTRYPGGYDTYRSLRAQVAAAADLGSVAAMTPSAPKRATIASGPKPLTFAERKELDGLLDEITALEAAAEKLHARLSDPSLYVADPSEAKRVQSEHDQVMHDLAQRMARWEELEARRELKRS